MPFFSFLIPLQSFLIYFLYFSCSHVCTFPPIFSFLHAVVFSFPTAPLQNVYFCPDYFFDLLVIVHISVVFTLVYLKQIMLCSCNHCFMNSLFILVLITITSLFTYTNFSRFSSTLRFEVGVTLNEHYAWRSGLAPWQNLYFSKSLTCSRTFCYWGLFCHSLVSGLLKLCHFVYLLVFLLFIVSSVYKNINQLVDKVFRKRIWLNQLVCVVF